MSESQEVPIATDSEANTYIIVLRDGVSTSSFLRSQEEQVKAFSASSVHVFEHVLNGFTGSFSESHIESIKAHSDVKYVEADAKCYAYGHQSDATWNLARLSRIAPLEKVEPKYHYYYDTQAGRGVDIYIVGEQPDTNLFEQIHGIDVSETDTGIDTSHPSFENRASWGITLTGKPNVDTDGHGTHVAGIAMSKQYGVAKEANAIAVKIQENKDSRSTLLVKALDWILINVKFTKRPSIVNLSIGGDASQAIDDSVKKLFDTKISVVAAAGNNNKDAKFVSPARSPFAITVGATTFRDKRYKHSNYGSVVNVFAPGEDIISTWLHGGSTTYTGTSMAAPHVSGLTACLKSLESTRIPSNFWAYVHGGILHDIPDKTPNLLAYNGFYNLGGWPSSAADGDETNEDIPLES
uniref:Uncharacterized protein n=1 Tax=Psilocybe cubensis TaxID=181762 RepID=A0A8H8CGR8_PSICU